MQAPERPADVTGNNRINGWENQRGMGELMFPLIPG